MMAAQDAAPLPCGRCLNCQNGYAALCLATRRRKRPRAESWPDDWEAMPPQRLSHDSSQTPFSSRIPENGAWQTLT